jgi:hypothetical protein
MVNSQTDQLHEDHLKKSLLCLSAAAVANSDNSTSGGLHSTNNNGLCNNLDAGGQHVGLHGLGQHGKL